GLSFAQSQAMKKQLWLVILKAGQQRTFGLNFFLI
ncbi:hypothetical protein ABTE28_19275, partial [Acinetobacter baumannii]